MKKYTRHKLRNKRKKTSKRKTKIGGGNLPINFMSFSLEQALYHFNNMLKQICIRNNSNRMLYLSVINKDGIYALCINIVIQNTPIDESKQIITRGKRSRPEFEYIHTCISQINLDIDPPALTIDSKTMDEFQRHNLNTLLRSLVVLLGNKIDSRVRYLHSYPSNYLSAYSLINKFNGVAYDEDGNKINVSTLKSVDDYGKFYKDYELKTNDKFTPPIYEVRVDFGYKNMNIAYDIFVSTLSKMSCSILDI